MQTRAQLIDLEPNLARPVITTGVLTHVTAVGGRELARGAGICAD